MSQDHSFQVLTKMQNHNAQKSINASFKWYEKEVTVLFLSAKSVVQFVSTINSFSSLILLLFSLLHINVILFGLFFQNEINYDRK